MHTFAYSLVDDFGEFKEILGCEKLILNNFIFLQIVHTLTIKDRGRGDLYGSELGSITHSLIYSLTHSLTHTI